MAFGLDGERTDSGGSWIGLLRPARGFERAAASRSCLCFLKRAASRVDLGSSMLLHCQLETTHGVYSEYRES